jgi:hypothetical protein
MIGFVSRNRVHFVILRYAEGSLVVRAISERSFGVPQDDKYDAASGYLTAFDCLAYHGLEYQAVAPDA